MKLRSVFFSVFLVAGTVGFAEYAESATLGPTGTPVTFVSDQVDLFADADSEEGTVNDEDTLEDFRTFSGNVSVQSGGSSAATIHDIQVEGTGDEVTSVTSGGSTSAASGGDIDEGFAATDMDVIMEVNEPVPYTLDVEASANTSNADSLDCTGVVVELESESGVNDRVRAEEGGPTNCNGPESVDQTITGGLEGFTVLRVASVSRTLGAETANTSWEVTLTIEPLCDNAFDDGTNIIQGTPDDDFLCGGGGDDQIQGFGGEDTILGGAGSDTIEGGADKDILRGGPDRDFIAGEAGKDEIEGGAGNDGRVDSPISGGADNDTINGGQGFDFIDGDLGSDEIKGGAGNSRDDLNGCNLTDPLCSADQAALDAAQVTDADTMFLGEGGGFMTGGAGKDTMAGSPAFDDISGGPELDLIDAFGGGDRVRGDAGGDGITLGEGNDSGTNTNFQTPLGAFGGAGDDLINGQGGDDLLEGGSGPDILGGQSGEDKLRGQDAGDCLTGHANKDVLVGGAAGDRLFARDGVRDTVRGNGQGPGVDRAQIDSQLDNVAGVENRNLSGDCF